MKHIGSYLFSFIDDRKLVKKDIANAIGMNPSQFNQLRHRPSIDCAVYEKICNAIGISPSGVFESDTNSTYRIDDINNVSYNGNVNMSVGDCSPHLANLLDAKEKQLADKERIIAEKERMIAYLTGISDDKKLL